MISFRIIPRKKIKKIYSNYKFFIFLFFILNFLFIIKPYIKSKTNLLISYQFINAEKNFNEINTLNDQIDFNTKINSKLLIISKTKINNNLNTSENYIITNYSELIPLIFNNSNFSKIKKEEIKNLLDRAQILSLGYKNNSNINKKIVLKNIKIGNIKEVNYVVSETYNNDLETFIYENLDKIELDHILLYNIFNKKYYYFVNDGENSKQLIKINPDLYELYNIKNNFYIYELKDYLNYLYEDNQKNISKLKNEVNKLQNFVFKDFVSVLFIKKKFNNLKVFLVNNFVDLILHISILIIIMKILLLKNLDKDLVRIGFLYLSIPLLILLLVLDQTKFNTSGISNLLYFYLVVYLFYLLKYGNALKNFLK